MRSIVVFLVGTGLMIYGLETGEGDLRYSGILFMAIGIAAMAASWVIQNSSEKGK